MPYISVNYSPHVVHYIPSIYLTYKGKFVPFDAFSSHAPSPNPRCFFFKIEEKLDVVWIALT